MDVLHVTEMKMCKIVNLMYILLQKIRKKLMKSKNPFKTILDKYIFLQLFCLYKF